MCGVVGVHGDGCHAEARAMLERLAHRGPDDHGEVSVNGSWLGHRRLSIVDVESGAQPLSTEDEQLWLVGNGEVYNHDEVRLLLDTERYATGSDNEVALHLLRERGPDALCELEGMFALLAAGTDHSFVAARDPVGIKPLYWARTGGSVLFASEMAAFGQELLPRVEAFPPGHHWTPESGLVRFAHAVPEHGRTGSEADGYSPGPADLERTRDVLTDAVERQLMGDVPVGVFLSGGLDSNLVAAIAADILADRGERLQTFAVGLADSPDLLAARATAKLIGSEHHERVYTADEAVEAVEPVVRAIEHFDPSLVRSAVPNYLLAEMTVRHVKVVLTGEGADELFAGYDYLASLEGPEQLHAEIVRTVESLHNLNLQRCDRVTMAHGLEARVPFLHRTVIRYALGLPAAWKTHTGGPEKRLLRDAFTGVVADELLWREKSQFGDGSGAAGVLTQKMEERASEEEFERERESVDPPLRTREELAYYRIFREHLGGVRPERTLARFATA